MLKRILFYGLCVSLFAGTALGMSREPAPLQTKDKTCNFNFLTPKNTQGWYISTSEGLCKEGVVQGHGEVTIHNAFGSPVEQVYGFFNGGYWTGDTAVDGMILSRTINIDGSQKVLFSIPNTTYLDFQFIGQMTSKKQRDGTYTPFSFCNPLRVLIQTQEVGLFQDTTSLTKIIDAIAKQARTMCPAEQKIMLFGSTKEQPLQDEIFFYAEIDLSKAQIHVLKNDPQGQVSVPQNRIATTDILQEPVPAFEPPDPQQPTAIVTPDDVITPVLPVMLAKTNDIEKSTKDVSTEIDNTFDKVPHLLVSSRILQKPVFGTAVVHIGKVSGKTAYSTDKKLHLNGDELISGWAVISGEFNYKSAGEKSLQGSVTVTSIVPCTADVCKDIR